MESTAPSARRSPVARLFMDEQDDLRVTRLLGVVVGSVVLVALASYIGLLMAAAGSPEALAVWVVGAMILVKVPLLCLVWWVITRRREHDVVGGWSGTELREITGYLEREARSSLGRPDAAQRLAYFSREARFVAEVAAPGDRVVAQATASRIEALASEAGLDTRPRGRAAPPR